MACSKFEYVKSFEEHRQVLPNTWFVVRIDGHCFTKFTKDHGFAKPNDMRALHLMNACAAAVVAQFPDIMLAYGQSDEFSFLFRRQTQLFERRVEKIATNVVSLFSANYVLKWSDFFGDHQQSNEQQQQRQQPSHQQKVELKYPPCFDARVVCYPSEQNVRDYFSWRQADCHINNLYNTCFWALVQHSGHSEQTAQNILKDTDSGMKNELLFSKYNTNYNSLPQIFRKGSVLFKKPNVPVSSVSESGVHRTKAKAQLVIEHIDIISSDFWINNPHILQGIVPKSSKV